MIFNVFEEDVFDRGKIAKIIIVVFYISVTLIFDAWKIIILYGFLYRFYLSKCYESLGRYEFEKLYNYRVYINKESV